jgi:UDP-glucuronate 4-epimerase
VDNFDPFYDRAIKESNLKEALESPAFRFVEMDLKDGAATDALMAHGWDVVAHLAGRGGVRRSIEEPVPYLENNYLATLTVLEAMKTHGVHRLVYASTSSVYGNRSDVPFREDDRADWPVSPYSATKKACEVLCHAYHQLYGMDVYVLRFFTVYGPRQRPDMAIHKFVSAIAHHKPVERFGDGSMVRDYTYVDDITSGVVRAVERVMGYEIINIGGSMQHTLAELISAIEALLGEKAVVTEKEIPPGDVWRTLADTSKAHRLLDFSPKTSLEEGLRQFIQWHREEHKP